MYCISKTLKPEIFQGRYRKKDYFEGWYFKLVDEAEENVFAVIPGIAYGNLETDRHAFIQVIDSKKNRTWYFSFDIKSFHYSSEYFCIQIEDNTFDRNYISLNLQQEGFKIRGSLEFYNIIPYPQTILNPGIMGPFAFMPFMQCYHGVVNIQHKIEGTMDIGDSKIDFTRGIGYIEKDWGTSFPDWWVWIQSNHFADENVSLMFSVARIPWMGKHFTGFLSYLFIKGKLYRFATYTGAKINYMVIKNGNIQISISGRKYTMRIHGKYKEGGILKAPREGVMNRQITESISSDIMVLLEDRHGNIIFKGYGRNTGMEIVSAD